MRMAAIKIFRGGGASGSGRRKITRISGSGCGGGCGAVFKILIGCSMIFLLFGPSTTSAFFIDLDALGFTMSKNNEGDVARDDSSLSASDSSSQLLIATPSPTTRGQPQEILEIESKTDPNKSVKLTLAELKQLVLGTVKDMTPNPPPINIKITTNKDRPSKNKGTSSNPTSSPTSTTASPKPKSTKSSKKKKFNPFKFTDSMLEAFANSRDPEAYENDDDDAYGSHWKRPQSTSFILPPYDDDGIEEHYTKSNEVMDMDGGRGEISGGGDNKGWFKSVFRTPTRVINNYSKSFNRWVKPKQQKQSHRPITDITYHPRDRHHRRRNPPPRRPSSGGGGRRKGGGGRRRPGHRRRGQYERPRNRYSSYYDDKYDTTSEYSSHRQDGGPYYGDGGGDDQFWDRTDHLTSRGATLFDSTMPHDDTPYNMSPPRN